MSSKHRTGLGVLDGWVAISILPVAVVAAREEACQVDGHELGMREW